MNWKIIRIIDTYLGIPLLRAFSLVKRRRQNRCSSSDSVKRILLIKFWGIGNIFMILPSIQALKAAYPDAVIDFLTLDSNREALAALGAVDSIVTINTGSATRFVSTWLRGTSFLKKNCYDIIIDFEQFARFSVLIASRIGAPEIIGFDTCGQFRSWLFSRAVPYDNTLHITRSFFTLATAAGACAGASLPQIRQAGIDGLQRRGGELLRRLKIEPNEICVVMHVGTSENFRERRWLPERYAALADLFTNNFQARIVFTGLAEESFLAREAVGYLRVSDAVVDLSGQLDFADYFALISVADLVISADTAAIHLASAVDTAVVGLYGPNTPLLYGPWGSKGLAVYQGFDCSPCITNFNAKLHTCRHAAGRGACMHAIEAADVFAAIQQHYFSPTAPCRLEKLAGS
ncbi:MAG TPA: glycosyltransferase family 9 protein [Desulfuromonadaceae bacterium]|jgi:ADP-heptose:LPS heptosyltransferase